MSDHIGLVVLWSRTDPSNSSSNFIEVGQNHNTSPTFLIEIQLGQCGEESGLRGCKILVYLFK